MSDYYSTSREAFDSDTYSFRRQNNEPCKNIKCFIFSTLEHDGHKKRTKDGADVNRDVDLDYLRLNFADIYSKDEDVFIHKQLSGRHKNFSGFIDFLEKSNYLRDIDCLFFVFLTYVTEGGKLRLSEEDMALNEIVDKIKYLLPDRPKVLLVQADDIRLLEEPLLCRGPVMVEDKIIAVPTDGDIIQIVSNIPGEFARYSDENNPSFLIKVFCDVMKENANRPDDSKDDLLSLTVDINHRIDAEITKIIKIIKDDEREDEYPWKRAPDLEIPLVTSTLRRKLII